MNMLLAATFSFGFALSGIVLCATALCRPAFLPTAGWLALMVIPFALQAPTLRLPFAGWQALGVATILVALVVADSIAYRHFEVRETPRRAVSAAAVALLAFGFLVPATVHVLLVKTPPLAELALGHESDWERLMALREDSAKLLAVPEFIKVLFNWSIAVFAPAAIVAAAMRRLWLAALGLLTVSVAYAMFSLAKSPVIILLYTLLIAASLSPDGPRRISRSMAVKATFAVGLVAGSIAWSALSHDAGIARWTPKTDATATMHAPKGEWDSRLHPTLGDYRRMRPPEIAASMDLVTQAAEYLVYRIFLVPPEVSYRWYQYYADERLGFFGMSPMRAAPGFVHPAQRVSNWALTGRFPDRYPESGRAYASLDADAYARFGPAGIFLASIVLIAVRVLLAFACRTAASLPFLAVGLALLSVIPAVGSLGALLVSQGLLAAIALAFLPQPTRCTSGPMGNSSKRPV